MGVRLCVGFLGGCSGVAWQGTRTLQGVLELSLPGLALLPPHPQRSLLLRHLVQPLPQPPRLLLTPRQLRCGTEGTAWSP